MSIMTRGRKPLSQEDIDVGRAKILTAANRLFVKQGYKSVSMRALARETGFSVMSLYRYYENKRAILMHIWAVIFDQLFADCRKSAERAETPKEALVIYAITFVEYWVANPDNYMMVYGEIDIPAGGESFFADSALVAEELSYLRDLLASSMGPRLGFDFDLALQQLLCAMHGVCHSVVTIPELRWQDTRLLITGLVRGLLV